MHSNEPSDRRSNESFLVVGEWEDGSPEWLAARHEGIGASDTPSILEAEGAYKTRLQVWAEKVNKEVQAIEDERFMEILTFGHKMEPVIRETLQERTGMKVVPEKRTLAHPEHPFIRANLDGWIEMDGVMVPAELKNVSEFMGSKWEDEPPLKFNIQLQHQMYVVGADRGVLAAVIGGNRFVYAVIDRNEKFISQMERELIRFWEMVTNNDRPEPVAEDIDLLKTIFVPDDDIEVALPAECMEWAKRLDEAKENIKEWEKEKRKYEALIWDAMGNARTGEMPGGGGFKVVSVNKKGYYVADSEYKYLRRIKE